MTVAAPCHRAETEDLDLAKVVAAWDRLPEAIRRAVLALVDSTKTP